MEKFLLIRIIWILYRNGVFHWILNNFQFIFHRLIHEELLAYLFYVNNIIIGLMEPMY